GSTAWRWRSPPPTASWCRRRARRTSTRPTCGRSSPPPRGRPHASYGWWKLEAPVPITPYVRASRRGITSTCSSRSDVSCAPMRRLSLVVVLALAGIAACANTGNNNPTIDAPPAQCADGIDNDGDGKTDFPDDPGCDSANDTDEYNVVMPDC